MTGFAQVRAILHVALLLLIAVLAAPAGAHPLSQGGLDVVVHSDHVAVRARITVEEVIITEMMTAMQANAPGEGAGRSLDESYPHHAGYLAQHIQITADSVPLVGRVVHVMPPTAQPAGQVGPDRAHVIYQLEYAPGVGKQALSKPRRIGLSQDVLVGLEFAPGATAEASYVIRIGAQGGPVTEGLLLTAKQPVLHEIDWSAAGSQSGSGQIVQSNRGRLILDYTKHGIHHILSGYDHLLFISALVLAAVSVSDLVKVVTAFTIAHTITLTLAALRLVHLPSGIVEPMIAASIVFVALQNVLWPKQSRGWSRLAVAFGFGLFHGLGFAGGLLDAMQEMSGLTIVLAIVAFSLGVEIGHQMIVLPLFGALKLAR